jgi:hypothetical protein
MTPPVLVALLWCAAALLWPSTLAAHDGPPFPIVSDRRGGAYTISVWTDPDTTDDGSPGGQFWIVLGAQRGEVPAGTHVTISVTPLEPVGAPRSMSAAPQRGDTATQYAELTLGQEGRYAVRVAIDGPLGDAAIESEVTATYDLRPPLFAVVLYIAPFVLVGLLWTKLLIRRRRAT